MEQKQDINYYEERLKFVIDLFIDHEKNLLEKNLDKIVCLVDGYKQFKDNDRYNPKLVGAVETFIL